MSRHDLRLSPEAALTCITAGIFLFGYLEPCGTYTAFSAVKDASPVRFDRITVHTMSGALIIIGLLGNERLGRSLAKSPFRLLGRLSFPVYLFHCPLLCSLACALFVLLRPFVSLHDTLLLVAVVYTPLVVAVGYLFARVDEIWLHWVNRFAARLVRSAPT
jgi:peptidoglycan/LPS O-acetylase OafA/YrhL